MLLFIDTAGSRGSFGPAYHCLITAVVLKVCLWCSITGVKLRFLHSLKQILPSLPRDEERVLSVRCEVAISVEDPEDALILRMTERVVRRFRQ